jgi:hypothetical protein
MALLEDRTVVRFVNRDIGIWPLIRTIYWIDGSNCHHSPNATLIVTCH